jgi:hypothetical protein
MPAVSKRISFAFEIGERVWLVCDPSASGIIRRYCVDLGYLPKYVVAFPNGLSTHIDDELTRDEPNPFQAEIEDE